MSRGGVLRATKKIVLLAVFWTTNHTSPTTGTRVLLALVAPDQAVPVLGFAPESFREVLRICELLLLLLDNFRPLRLGDAVQVLSAVSPLVCTGRAPLARVEAEAAAAYPPAGTRVCKERQGILPWLGTRVPNLVGGPPTGQTALHFGALPGALEPSHANTTT